MRHGGKVALTIVTSQSVIPSPYLQASLGYINISKAVQNGQQQMEQYRLGQSVPLYDYVQLDDVT